MKLIQLSVRLMGVIMLIMFASSSVAAPIVPGLYVLSNHPDGQQAPPGYGLRLDGLLDGLASSRYTFDFDDAANGSQMFLNYDGSSIRIYGTAWGGLDIGSSHQNPNLWTIDVTYSQGLTTNVDGGIDDIIIDQAFDGTVLGTITSGLGTFELSSLSAVNAGFPFSFSLGDEDGSGHRGHPGLAGWGWLAVNGVHTGSQDWNFIMTPASQVPLPAGLWLMLSGLAALSFNRKR